VGSAIADSLSELTIGRTPTRVRTLGVPTQYIAHGKPAAILAELGLDAAGITESARSLCRAEGNVTA
jgi:1-deoxy-D-xylulose-5-phosphate synthase